MRDEFDAFQDSFDSKIRKVNEDVRNFVGTEVARQVKEFIAASHGMDFVELLEKKMRHCMELQKELDNGVVWNVGNAEIVITARYEGSPDRPSMPETQFYVGPKQGINLSIIGLSRVRCGEGCDSGEASGHPARMEIKEGHRADGACTPDKTD